MEHRIAKGITPRLVLSLAHLHVKVLKNRVPNFVLNVWGIKKELLLRSYVGEHGLRLTEKCYKSSR